MIFGEIGRFLRVLGLEPVKPGKAYKFVRENQQKVDFLYIAFRNRPNRLQIDSGVVFDISGRMFDFRQNRSIFKGAESGTCEIWEGV